MRSEVRLVGVGGQGIVWAATLIGSAASKQAGTNASVSVKYGAEVRGGFSKADIIISDEPQWFPWATGLDLLVVLSNKSLSKSDLRMVKSDGVLLLDSSLKEIPGHKAVRVAAKDTSKALFGTDRYMNSVLVGYLAGFLGVPSPDDLKKAMAEKVGRSPPEANLKAVEAGLQLRASG